MHRVASLFLVIASASLISCGGNNSTGGGPDAPPGTPDGPPAGNPDAPLPSGVVSIPLTSPDGSFYAASVKIGSQMFSLIADTGSTTLAVAGSKCTGCTGANPKYTPGSSATDTHTTGSAQYGSGSWMGEIYKDQVGLGSGTPDVQVSFGAMTSQTGFFDGSNVIQGLIGLGNDGALTTGTTSYLDALVKTGIKDVESFELCDSGGTMWVGGFDPNSMTGDPQYTSMNSQLPYYAVTLSDMKIGTTSVGFTSSTTITDTGTSLFYVPTAVANAVVAAANKQTSLWTGSFSNQQGIYCATAKTGVTSAMIDSTMGPLNLTFPGSGGSFTVSAPATRSYLLPVGGGSYCIGIADGATAGLPNGFALMGDIGLRGFVTVVDRVQKRVGFAPEKGCAASFAPHVVTKAVPLRERGHIPDLSGL
jgi:hypothetical protein